MNLVIYEKRKQQQVHNEARQFRLPALRCSRKHVPVVEKQFPLAEIMCINNVELDNGVMTQLH